MPRVLTQTDVADFRERLCEAATRLFDARGREGFTMRELASELGVSAMTPYRYFKDKDDILAAVRARAFTRWSERLETAFAGAKTAPEKSAAVYPAYVAFAFAETPALWASVRSFATRPERLPRTRRRQRPGPRDHDGLRQATCKRRHSRALPR